MVHRWQAARAATAMAGQRHGIALLARRADSEEVHHMSIKLFKQYREFRAIVQALADLEIDPITGMLMREYPDVVLGLLNIRAKKALT